MMFQRKTQQIKYIKLKNRRGEKKDMDIIKKRVFYSFIYS